MNELRELLGGLVAAARALWTQGPRALELGVPWALLTLLPLVVAAVLLVILGAPRATLFFSRGEVAAKLPKGRGHLARRLAWGALAAALGLGCIALADPFIQGEPEPGSTEGIDLVVALDVSGSMRAADFRPQDRLYVAKKVIVEQVLSRQRDRVGLVVFAGEAFTQAPLTHDKALLTDILGGVRTGVITDGTAIGDGLATSLNRLKDSKAKTKAVILLTDGDNNAASSPPRAPPISPWTWG